MRLSLAVGKRIIDAGTSTADGGHVRLVVACAGGRGEVVKSLELLALSSIESAAVFSSTRETRLVPGIGAMSSPCASSQANADLRRCGVEFGGDGLGLVDDAEVPLELPSVKRGLVFAPVIV